MHDGDSDGNNHAIMLAQRLLDVMWLLHDMLLCCGASFLVRCLYSRQNESVRGACMR